MKPLYLLFFFSRNCTRQHLSALAATHQVKKRWLLVRGEGEKKRSDQGLALQAESEPGPGFTHLAELHPAEANRPAPGALLPLHAAWLRRNREANRRHSGAGRGASELRAGEASLPTPPAPLPADPRRRARRGQPRSQVPGSGSAPPPDSAALPPALPPEAPPPPSAPKPSPARR